MTGEEVVTKVREQYANFVNPSLGKLLAFAGFGAEMRAEGCYMWDEEGKKYLDCLGGYGVFTLGHRHPKVIEAIKRQLDVQPIGGKVFFSPPMADLAEKLAEISPGKLQFTFMSNSGAEAVEAALKFAKMATGRSKIVATEGGYHGKTIGALSTTGREKYRKPFLPLMPGPVFVPYGDSDAMRSAVDLETAAVIIETVQGEGGIHVAPKGYLSLIREFCDRSGALLIADEVQTGFARTGRMFGCNHEDIHPDIMPLAKGLSGGVIPVGATMGTPAVWEAVFEENPLIHTSTFGGNPLASVAALTSIQVIEEEGLVQLSAELGNYMKQALVDCTATHKDLIHEVRGQGLMIGVEFTMDDVGELAIAQMVKRGLVAAYTLNNRKVIRFEPPLIITKEEIDWAAKTFGEAITETSEMLAAFA